MQPFLIPFQYALASWSMVVEALTGKVDVMREGALLGSLRYDPDLGFGQVPPTLQPMLEVLREALMPFDERIRFMQRV